MRCRSEMEDMTAKIQELLSDKESMKQINELAQMFTSSSENNSAEDSGADSSGDSLSALPIDMEKLMMIQNLTKGADGGKGAALLLALKPFLKEERRERVDKAVRILKLLAVGEMMKESGLLGDFLK